MLHHLPNLITVGRFLLVPPTLLALVQGRYALALVLMAVAGASDGVDGYLARRFGWGSRIGAVLDPLADKTLLVSAFVTLGVLGYIPLWAVALVVARDLIIVAGAGAFRLLFGRLDLMPSLISKANTLVQVVLVVEVMARLAGVGFPAWLAPALLAVMAVTTIASGAHYVWTWSRIALAEHRRLGAGVEASRAEQ
jgi:cardiolipin synthase